MQRYHIGIEGIPEYINDLKDSQVKAERINDPIMDATLIIIATKAILSTEKFPHANKDWEELDVAQRTWKRWKTTYCAAAKKSAIKNKSASGKYQFSTAHSATQQHRAPIPPGGAPESNTQHMGLEALDGYFDNLAAAAKNKKAVLEQLFTNISTLATSNAEMVDRIKNHGRN